MKVIYKIVNTLVALALVPVLIFLPMFKFSMTVGVKSDNQLLDLFGGLLDINKLITNAIGVDLENLPEQYTLKGAYNMFFGENAKISVEGFDTSVLPDAMVKFFTAAGILFALSLLCAVIVLVIGLFVKKKLVTASFAAAGLAFAFAANKCFTHIASQLVSGKISLTPLLRGLESLSQYKTYMNYVNLDIRTFELSLAFTLVMVILAALLILGVAFHLAESTERR